MKEGKLLFVEKVGLASMHHTHVTMTDTVPGQAVGQAFVR
jgi:hypothetical protein